MFTFCIHLLHSVAPFDFPVFHRDFPLNAIFMVRTSSTAPGRKMYAEGSQIIPVAGHTLKSVDADIDPSS